MKVGLIGPRDIVSRTHSIIKQEHPNDQLVDLPYGIYLESPEIVLKNQPFMDALLFAGKLPFKIAEVEVEKKIPWEYMPRRKNTLFRAMLEASFVKHYDIKSISIDTYEDDLVHSAYQEIGVKSVNLNIYIAEQKILKPDYMNYLCKFHMDNYQDRNVSCVITGVSEIYYEMQKLGIPCIRTVAAEDIIISTYNQLKLKHYAQIFHDNQIAVIAIKVETPSIYSTQSNNEYSYVINNMKILEKIHSFASRFDAAITTYNQSEFLIFTTKKILELETNNLESIYLLDLIQETAEQNIKIGIGYGQSIRNAKFNAYNGVAKAMAYDGNVEFVIMEENETKEPIKYYIKNKHVQLIDKVYFDISKRTGISINTIHKIYTAIAYFEKNEFTTREFAIVCDMSQRNMDRIISKLIDAHFCEIVGERLMKDTGRPSRILKLLDLTSK